MSLTQFPSIILNRFKQLFDAQKNHLQICGAEVFHFFSPLCLEPLEETAAGKRVVVLIQLICTKEPRGS